MGPDEGSCQHSGFPLVGFQSLRSRQTQERETVFLPRIATGSYRGVTSGLPTCLKVTCQLSRFLFDPQEDNSCYSQVIEE